MAENDSKQPLSTGICQWAGRDREDLALHLGPGPRMAVGLALHLGPGTLTGGGGWRKLRSLDGSALTHLRVVAGLGRDLLLAVAELSESSTCPST